MYYFYIQYSHPCGLPKTAYYSQIYEGNPTPLNWSKVITITVSWPRRYKQTSGTEASRKGFLPPEKERARATAFF